MFIPKIIHQTYKKKKNKYSIFSDNWKKKNIGWEYIFYEDKDIDIFLEDHNHKIEKDFSHLDIFLKNCSLIEKIDIFRYLLMYYIGGIYCDIDTNCFKSFDLICNNEECILGIESYITHNKKQKLGYKFNYSIGNAILISKKKHPIFKLLIENILQNKYNNNIKEIYSEHTVQKTGPGVLTKTIQNIVYSDKYNNCNIRNFKYQNSNIKILEQIFFFPPSKPAMYNIYPLNINIYSNHVCEGSWKNSKDNAFSTMDFIPYPWLWMYKYKIDYIMSIISMIPVIKTSFILYPEYKLQSFMMMLTFISAFLYHTNEYLGCKRHKILHKLDNIMAYNTIPIMYFLKIFKNNIKYLNLSTILITLFTSIYQYFFYSYQIIEILQIIPFIYFLNDYFIKYKLLTFLTLISFLLGNQEFDYFSSRKYHTLWHLSGSLLLYNIIFTIIH